MASKSPANADDEDRLLGDAAAGDAEALRNLFELHRERLRRMVDLRLDSRLAARVDASASMLSAMHARCPVRGVVGGMPPL